jgi:hypothetical protein
MLACLITGLPISASMAVFEHKIKKIIAFAAKRMQNWSTLMLNDSSSQLSTKSIVVTILPKYTTVQSFFHILHLMSKTEV